MKTKLSRVGRSSVSVILAVMMLLSTMLVGTVTTANAAVDLTKVSKVYVDASVAKYNSSTLMSSTKPANAYAYKSDGVNTYTDENSNGTSSWPGAKLKDEGNNIYSILVSNDDTYIIFNSGSGGCQTGNLTLPDNWKTTPMIYRGSGTTGSEGWDQYSEPSLTYTVNFGVNGGNGALNAGSVTSGSSVDAGTKVTFTASPNTGYEVEGWYSDSACTNKIDAAGTAETYEVTVNANTDVYVKFKEVSSTDKYSIHVKLADNVSTYSFSLWAYGDPNETNAYGYKDWNSKEIFTISDQEWHSYTFKNDITNWNLIIVNNGTEVSYKNEYNADLWITVKGTNQYDVTTTAPTPTYKVTYGVNGGNGTLSAGGVTSGSSVDQGTEVTFTAAPADGYEVEGWYSDADCKTAITGATGTTYTTTVTADTTVYAKFSAVDYNVTYTEDGECYTVSDVSATTANFGDTVTFTVTPKKGYQIDSVKANDTDAVKGEDGKYTFTMPARDVTITVTASLASYNIVNGGNDTLTFKVGDNSVDTAKMGDKVTVRAAKTGYTLTGIEVVADNGDTVEISGLTFTMPASAVTVTPVFAVNNHQITYDDTVTGLDSVGVATTADYNTTVAVTVTAKSGYQVTDITVKTASGDSVNVTTTADKYQFTMPDADVIITPSIEVAEIDKPTVDFYGGAGDSTPNISANQLYPITAKASAAANSEIKSAVAEITSDNASDATLTKSDTGYNFTSNVEGTFTIKYTVVAVSTLDSSKTSTVEKTITITTTFTETQKAYNDLASCVNSDAVKAAVDNHTQDSSYYTADSYAVFESALTAAQALLTGLPVSSADNTSAYVDAKSALETALGNLVVDTHYYIGGRFMGQSWNPGRTDLQMTKVEGTNGLYKYETGKTVAELSVQVDGVDQYFFVHTGDGYEGDYYGSISSNGHSFQNNTDINKLSVKKYTNDNKESQYVKFTDTADKSSNVVIYFDISDNSNPKLYYTADVRMRITGSLEGAGGWNNSYDSALKFDTREADGSYSKTINITADDISGNKNYFRLIDSEKYDSEKYKEYGPLVSSTVKDNIAIDSYTSSTTSYSTYENSATSLYFSKVGTYKLHYVMGTSTPKVWVEYTAETKNVSFSITGDGTGTVKLNDSAVADKDEKSLVVASNLTITATPDDDSYLKTFTVNGNAVEGNEYKATVSEDVAVVVEFAKKQLHAIQVTSDNGGTAKADLSNAYSGQTVTVTVNADDDHVFDGISVKENASQSTVTCTQNDDGTYSFVMPDDAVNVYAKFREKLTYNVTVSSENQELGKVSLNGSEDTLTKTVKEGDTVTIKATAIDPNTFSQWTISGKYTIQDSKTATDPEITLVVNGDVKASASFTETAPYQVAYGSSGTLMYMNKTKYDGIYVSTATVAASTNFTIYDSNAKKYAYVSSDDYYWINDEHPSPTIRSTWSDSYVYASKNGLVRNAYSTAKYVVFDANSGTITLTDDPDYGTKVTLYAKLGTYHQDGCISEYASSTEATGTGVKLTSTSITYDDKTSTCNTYSVPFDTNINVKTTLNSKYVTAGYYVAAYCVNGQNYSASAVDAEKGIYQANITITEDLVQNGVVEVTPIYYNRNIEKNDDYITFYVDFDQAESDWGSTISVDAYCYINGDQSEADHLFGSYPGQPMVRDGRYYVINVPRYRYYIDTDGSLVKDTNSPVSGVTLNNYFYDAVHANLVPIKRNMQTYDFSDFVRLANLDGVRTIMFQNQFYNAKDDTAKRNMKVVYGVDEGGTIGNAAKTISNIESANVNPWKDFTDYYGRDTDALGNILTDDQKNNDCLYIISTGSFNSNSTAYSTKGEWVTIWNVYDHNGNLVTYGTPADFLDSSTDQYKALNTADYLGKPVKISYEKGQFYENDPKKSDDDTSRTDGRWYYSKLGQEFTSDVAIEYKYKDNTDYKADTDSNADNNTGFVGTTTKATATINNVTTASFTSVTETAHLNVKVTNGWRFDGWYIKQGDKYTKISDDYTNISADVLMSNSYHIIARVSEIPSGTLELDHTAYTGTDPASHSGTGFYYISAILYNQDGSIKKTFTETQGKISIGDYAATDELEITLRAVGHGDNTIYAVYEGEAGGYSEIGEEDYRGLPNFSYTFSVPAGSLFRNDKLMVNALNYYTDIVKVGGTCDITYKYNDRFNVEGAGNMVSYVVRNVELSSEEIQNNYQPFDETITKYAPRIDTMYVDTKWILTDAGKVDKGKSQATVIATQTNKMCKVYHPVLDSDGNYTEIADSSYYTVEFNSLLINSDGSFMLSAPEKSADGTKLFSYWNVYKVNEDGEKTDELVTKCYERNFGLRIMADYYIEPVYDDEIPTLTANINSPVMNREVYGESTSATDKVYVDLLTAFTSTAIPTFKENTTNLSVECGVFVVRNNTNTLTEDERNQLVAAAQAGEADTTSSILANHHINDEDALLIELNALVKNESVKNNANVTYYIGDENVRVTKYVFNNDALTNKNRIDKVIRYTNNTANQNYIFSAYAYVIIRNADGSVNEVVISDAQYYNICYVGNKA